MGHLISGHHGLDERQELGNPFDVQVQDDNLGDFCLETFLHRFVVQLLYLFGFLKNFWVEANAGRSGDRAGQLNYLSLGKSIISKNAVMISMVVFQYL